MTTYRLTYFDGEGRGEVARLLFAAANQPYEDIRVPYDDDLSEWKKFQPNTPFGQLPLLECDGVILAQSHAIERFLAKRFGLVGKTDLEQAIADMTVDTVESLIVTHTEFVYEEKDEAKREEMKNKYEKETYPSYLANMDKLLRANRGGDGYLVGDGLTWADIVFAYWVSWLGEIDGSKYPKLKALKARVEAQPGIAKWMKERPVATIF